MADPVFTEDEVREALMKLNCNKGPGPDGLFPCLLRKMSPFIASPLAAFFNASLRSGLVPKQWKEAYVHPIPKIRGSTNPLDYRPISLTPTLCKVMEGLIKQRLYDHLRGSLSPQQHGFIPRRSCLSNLLAAEETVTSFLDNGVPVDMLFLDFAKAFDCVDHRFLLAKLTSFGVAQSVIKWIGDLLNCRSFRVQVRDSLSSPSPVPSGVPQGSVLGPLLFVPYVDDLAAALKPHALFYADDGKILGPGNDPYLTQRLLDTAVEWSRTWDLPLNPNKCQHLHVGKGPEPAFHIAAPDGTHRGLTPVSIAKDLGVTLNSTFSPSSNVHHAVVKARRMLFFIRRSLSQPTPSTFIPLYKAYVRPHLEYAVQAISPFLKKDTLAIEKVQQLAVKLIKGFRRMPYLPSLLQLRLFSLERRRLRGDLITAFKIKTGLIDADWRSFFHPPCRPGLRGHPDKVWQQRPNFRRRQASFAVRVPPLWNKLPARIASATSLPEFKTNLDREWSVLFPDVPI